jgi:hypothetical protein
MLWRLGPDGWPVEQLDPTTGLHLPVFLDPNDPRLKEIACPWPAQECTTTTEEWMKGVALGTEKA